MNQGPIYYDIRSEFWARHFREAKEFTDYLQASDPEKTGKWVAMGQWIPGLTEEQKARLTGHGRPMKVLVHSGVWCGDCARHGAMLHRIGQACGPEVEVRWFERGDSQELTDELRICGSMRVPVTVFLSEEFHELGRVGDRSLTAYRSKARRELGPACDAGIVPPAPEELAAEQEEWVAAFERVLLMLRLAPPLRRRYGD